MLKRKLMKPKYFKNMSIAVLEIYALVVTTTIILCIFGAVYYHSDKSQKYELLNDSLMVSVEQLHSGLALPAWNIDEPQIEKVIESLMKNPAVYSVKVTLLDKNFLKTRGKHWEVTEGPIISFDDVRFIDQSMDINFNGVSLGTLHVALTTKFIDKRVKENAIRYFILILLLDLSLITSLYLVNRRVVLKPLLAIEQYAEKVSSGLTVVAGERPVAFPRELENLVHSIEKMVAQLEIRLEETKKAKEFSEAADRLKSEFLNIAAHELKTPLTSLLLLAQTTYRSSQKGFPINPAILEKIIKQTLRLSELVNDLLDTTKLESGGMILKFQKVDPNLLVEECVEDFKEQGDYKRFHFLRMKDQIEIEIDPGKIKQVLTNLMDNARKYAPGDSSIEIKVELKGDDQIRFSVTDHGEGITIENQASLFNRFFRVKSDVTILNSGLGLGLYIGRRIIALHGGTINVDSKMGYGSTFYFDLPIRKIG